MTLLVPNNGEGDMLNAIVAKAAAEDLVLHLFTSPTTLSESDTTASFTEATFTGYSSVTLTASNWTITEGDPSHADYPAVTFTSSAAQTAQDVYGYYLTRATSGRIAWAEVFTDGPYTIANNGDNITVTPYIELS